MSKKKYFGNLTKKISWFALPILILVSLSISFLLLNSLTYDFRERNFKKVGIVKLKEVSEYDVFLEGKNIGTSIRPISISIEDNNLKSYKIEIRKNDKILWEKNVKPIQGIARNYYPIIYPEEITFDYQLYECNLFLRSNNDIFCIQEKNNLTKIYKIYLQNLLVNTEINYEEFADITKIKDKDDLKNIQIKSSTNGDALLLFINNQVYLIKDKNYVEIQYLRNKKFKDIEWSVNSDYLLVKDNNKLIIYNLRNNSQQILYQGKDNEELEIQYTTQKYILLKSTLPERINLYQITYDSKISELDLPNYDNIKINNLNKAIDFTSKNTYILIETEKNLYYFNPENKEFIKINFYEGEKILLVDKENQIIITYNPSAPNQYRSYYMEYNENYSFVTINTEFNKRPISKILFNYGHNLILNYDDKIILTDTNGQNIREIKKNTYEEEIILAIKSNTNIFLYKKEYNPISKTFIIKISKIRN